MEYPSDSDYNLMRLEICLQPGSSIVNFLAEECMLHQIRPSAPRRLLELKQRNNVSRLRTRQQLPNLHPRPHPSLHDRNYILELSAQLYEQPQVIGIMASRFLAPAVRTASRTFAPARNFQTSAARRAEVVAAAPIKKPVGAFRGG